MVGSEDVGLWECDAATGANQKQAIVTVVKRKSGYAVKAKVPNKTADLTVQANMKATTPVEALVKTLNDDNGKAF